MWIKLTTRRKKINQYFTANAYVNISSKNHIHNMKKSSVLLHFFNSWRYCTNKYELDYQTNTFRDKKKKNESNENGGILQLKSK